jgi:hypothetical protein
MGDLVCKNAEMQAEINTNFSEIQIENCTGSISLTSKYGSINTILNTQLRSFKIQSVKTNIVLINRMCQEYSLSVQTKYAPVRFSEDCYIKKQGLLKQSGAGNTDETKQTLFYIPSGNLPIIDIDANYGTLNLN